MEWVNINHFDDNDKPRELTEEEINIILKQLPKTFAADEVAGEMIRKNMADNFRDILIKKKVSPSAIADIINTMQMYHNKSLIMPGTDIGVHASESIGRASTQMTLNSVAPWEQILVQDKDGVGHIYEIGKWIDELLLKDPTKIVHIPENRTQYLELEHPVTIASCNEDGIVTWDKMTAVTKHLPVGDLIKVKTKSGREVTATQSKSLLVWNGSKIVHTAGKDVKVGDMVPILNQVPKPDFVYDELDLKRYLSTTEWMYGSEMYKVFHDYGLYNRPGKLGFWTAVGRLDEVPFSRGDSCLLTLQRYEKDELNYNYIYPKKWGGCLNTKIPEKIKLDKKFGQIVGLYLAEGWATDTFVGISNNAPEIRKLVYDWCDSLGITHHTVTKTSELGTSNDVKIHSALFARLFKRWTGTGSAKKIMPDEILFGNEEFIIGVLDGYFAGDGCVCKNNGALTIGSVSKPLILGTSFLCSRLGIFGKISGGQQKKNNKGSKNILYMNTFSIRNLNADIWADLIGSCHDNKDKLMKINYKRGAGWGQQYIKHNNVMLDPIVTIEFIKGVEYVYDVTVPATLNFSLLNGLCQADTFHNSGASKAASTGIAAFEEIIYAKKERKSELCFIHYLNKDLTYEEVLDTRKDIVGCVFSDFVQDYLYTRQGENYVKDYTIDMYKNLPKKWWHNSEFYVKSIIKSDIPKDDAFVLRIKLNLTEMYKYKVTINDLVDVFKREIDSPVSLLYGPMEDAIIDVYACANFEEKKKSKKGTNINVNAFPCSDQNNKTDDSSVAYLLQNIIIPSLNTLRVKGILGIRNLVPVVTPIISTIISDDDKYWKLNYDVDNITVVIKLLKLLGVTIVSNNGKSLMVKMPAYDDISDLINNKKDDYNNMDPIKYVAAVIQKEIQNNPDKEPINLMDAYKVLTLFTVDICWLVVLSAAKLRAKGISVEKMKTLFGHVGITALSENSINNLKYELVINMPAYDNLRQDVKDEVTEVKYLTMKPTDLIRLMLKKDDIKRKQENDKNATKLMRLSEIVTAEVDGSNLRGLMSLNFLDKTRLMSNNVHVVNSVLGIRAAKAFFIQELSQAISGAGLSIHPQHIILIADVFMSRGVPIGAMNNSTNKQLGPIDKATVAKAVEVFRSSALNSLPHKVSGVSTNIAFGIAPKVGTGYFDVGYDRSPTGELQRGDVPKNPLLNEDIIESFKLKQRNSDIKSGSIQTIKTFNPNSDINRVLDQPQTSFPRQIFTPSAKKPTNISNIMPITTITNRPSPTSNYIKNTNNVISPPLNTIISPSRPSYPTMPSRPLSPNIRSSPSQPSMLSRPLSPNTRSSPQSSLQNIISPTRSSLQNTITSPSIPTYPTQGQITPYSTGQQTNLKPSYTTALVNTQIEIPKVQDTNVPTDFLSSLNI